jgi:hypothetical protein
VPDQRLGPATKILEKLFTADTGQSRAPDSHYLGMRAWRLGVMVRPAVLAAVLTASVAMAGCDDKSDATLERPSAPQSGAGRNTASPAPKKPSTAEQILAQYEGFWSVVIPVADVPKERRRSTLEPYATEPALSRILRGVVAAEAYGRSGYGKYVLHPQSPRIKGAVATIRDCQDSSGVGQKNRKTGERLTRGVKRDPVVTTMRRVDGVWRVSEVKYLDGGCLP